MLKGTNKNPNGKINHDSNYENNRQKLNEIMEVLGVDVKYFKENSAANQPYQFAEIDKSLLFDILDLYKSRDFILIRKGQTFKVPIETLTFYLEAFTTLLEHLEIDNESIQNQREVMMQTTYYKLAFELDAVKHTMDGINKDIQQLLSDWDDNLLYTDRVALLSDLSEQLRVVQERFRHVYVYMDLERKNEAWKAERMDLKQRPEARDELNKKFLLICELQKNDQYLELTQQLDLIYEDSSFLKKKNPKYLEIFKKMIDIERDTQVQLFGHLIPPQKDSFIKLESDKALLQSLKSYEELKVIQKYKSEKPIMIESIYNERFEDWKERGN